MCQGLVLRTGETVINRTGKQVSVLMETDNFSEKTNRKTGIKGVE